MDARVVADAAVYARVKAANLAYYHAHAAQIAEQRKIKYRAAHPEPRPRGRPRKGVGGGGVVADGNTSSSSESA